MNTMLQPFGKSDTGKISSLENNLKFKLPEEYKIFLLSNNGGFVENRIFHVNDLDSDILIDVIFGIDTNDKEFDLWYLYEEYADELPEGGLVIGSDTGGNFILMIVDGEDAGIYYWDHVHFFPISSEEQNTYFVSPSFEIFWVNLSKLK